MQLSRIHFCTILLVLKRCIQYRMIPYNIGMNTVLIQPVFKAKIYYIYNDKNALYDYIKSI